jgi:hypothetical protein
MICRAGAVYGGSAASAFIGPTARYWLSRVAGAPLQRLTMFVDWLVNLYIRDIEPAQVNGHCLADRLSSSSAPVRKTGTDRQWAQSGQPTSYVRLE